jgi:hypothetical protein
MSNHSQGNRNSGTQIIVYFDAEGKKHYSYRFTRTQANKANKRHKHNKQIRQQKARMRG